MNLNPLDNNFQQFLNFKQSSKWCVL